MENELTIKNLQEEIEKLKKIQEQQVKPIDKDQIFIRFIYLIIRNNQQVNLH